MSRWNACVSGASVMRSRTSQSKNYLPFSAIPPIEAANRDGSIELALVVGKVRKPRPTNYFGRASQDGLGSPFNCDVRILHQVVVPVGVPVAALGRGEDVERFAVR